MKFKNLLPYFRDLLEFLPIGVPRDWEELSLVTPDRPTVILVSGFGAGYRTLSVIRRRLIRDGFNVLILTVDWRGFSDNFRGLYSLAERLSKLVLEVKKKNGMRRMPIFLVAHSAGGLVARYYVQQLGGSHYCELLVTLATPHQGTWTALFGFLSHLLLKAPSLMQLLPSSKFIAKLNSAPYPEGFPLISFSSPDDLLCSGNSTVIPEGIKQKSVEAIEIARLSHSGFLMSKRVYQALIERLDHYRRQNTAAKPPPAMRPQTW